MEDILFICLFLTVGQSLNAECTVPSTGSGVEPSVACAVENSLCSGTQGTKGTCQCATTHYNNGESCGLSKFVFIAFNMIYTHVVFYWINVFLYLIFNVIICTKAMPLTGHMCFSLFNI